ncbi:MAG: Lrp/AsnC family transcriptional regulator [Chloroflexi bacterium]|nr:Lrp/AsnC family transcriptional regulator [Chloroflexota bacterium]
MTDMNQLDLQLLNELQRGVVNKADLARAFSVSERTIHRRINSMMEDRTIKKVALRNPVLLGYSAWAKIGIKVDLRSLRSVARELVESPSIYFVAYSLGSYDFVIAVQFEDIDKLTNFVNTELAAINGIVSTETMILTSPRKYYNYYWPGQAAATSRPKIDELDRAIIGILEQDASVTPEELKSKIGSSSVSTIRKRIKTMLQNQAIKIQVMPNPDIFHGQVWATIGLTATNQYIGPVIGEILKNPSVYLVSGSTGRFNVILSARFSDMGCLTRFLNQELPDIKEINSIESFLHNRPLKYHNRAVPG